MTSPVSNTGGAPGYEPDFDGSHGAFGQPPAVSAHSSNEPSLGQLALSCASEVSGVFLAALNARSHAVAVLGLLKTGLDLAECLSDANRSGVPPRGTP
jgi:hypothetical protein